MPPITLSSDYQWLDPGNCPSDFLFTDYEMLGMLLTLDTNKASGPDNVSARMLKFAGQPGPPGRRGPPGQPCKSTS